MTMGGVGMSEPVDEYLKAPYTRILIPDETGGYSAEILEFPGCFAEGETADEAIQALDRAAKAWIEAALDQGQEIPPPFINQGYAGKVALRLPRSVHRRAAQLAERDGTSLNQFLLTKIAAGIGAEELYSRLVENVAAKVMEALHQGLSAATGQTINIHFNNFSGLPEGWYQRLRIPHPAPLPERGQLPPITQTAVTGRGSTHLGALVNG